LCSAAKFLQYLFYFTCADGLTWLNVDGISGITTTIANDGLVRSVDQCGRVYWRKSAVDQLKLVGANQRRPDRLDLDVRKRLANAPMSTGAEWNVAEFLLTQSSLVVKKSATFISTDEQVQKYIHLPPKPDNRYNGQCKVKITLYSSLQICLTITGTRVPHGITVT